MPTVMEDPFSWYDWNIGRIIGLPIRDCQEVTISGSNFVKWCLRVFSVVMNISYSLSYRQRKRTGRGAVVCASSEAYIVGR